MMYLRLLIIFTFLNLTVSGSIPKILWKYWQTDIKTYGVAEMFDEHHRYVLQGWDVRMLNKTSLITYLQQIPYYANDIDTINFTSVQSKSDYIRVLLLSYYGGVWSDQSAILVQDLSWLDFQNLRNNPDVLNKHGQQPQVIFFTHPYYGSKQVYNHYNSSTNTNTSYEIAPGYEIWFMAAQPNSTLLRQFLPELRQALLNQMTSNKKGPKYLDPLMQKQHVQLGDLNRNYYLGQLQVLQYVLQKKHNQLNKNSENSNTKKLAVWHYKIWHIKVEKGPFALLVKWGIKQTQILARYSRQEIEQQYNITIRYLIKIIGPDRIILDYYYFSFSRGETIDDKVNKIANLNQRAIEIFFCPELYRIYEPSIIYQYLIRNNSHHFNAQIVHEEYRPFGVQCSEMRQFVQLIKNQYGRNYGEQTDREYWMDDSQFLGKVYDREIDHLNQDEYKKLNKYVNQPVSPLQTNKTHSNPTNQINTTTTNTLSIYAKQQINIFLIKIIIALTIVVVIMMITPVLKLYKLCNRICRRNESHPYKFNEGNGMQDNNDKQTEMGKVKPLNLTQS